MESSRTRKRQRHAWDAAPSEREAARGEAAPVARGAASPPWRDDDREGHYVFDLGENLTPRCRFIVLENTVISIHKILSKIGEGAVKTSKYLIFSNFFSFFGGEQLIEIAGTFGRVLECWDRETRDYVAIKVVRSIRKYREAAMLEIDVLNLLGKNDRHGSRCVQLRRWFDYRNHICIVFEKLGPSLYDFLKRNKYYPFPVELVREFGRQLLDLTFYFPLLSNIDMHELRLIHTDLKPENILLVSSEYIKVPSSKLEQFLGVLQRKSQDEVHFKCLPKSSAIKLIDFGSTAFDNQNHSSIVSTRHYRAPEIILGLGWSYPCDMWSIGCILVELLSGEALFQTHENLEHLAMMERVLGPIPEHMIRKASSNASKYFRRGTRLNWPEGALSRESIRAVKKLNRLKEFVSQYVDHSSTLLTDLLYGLLRFEPSERLTAQEALNHTFFKAAV
ncbi:Serine/threonine-protein kinase AFC3 [Ananas comosus]|uniref:dual-specificity kinase n=1 Tax=Ananas comosus TaxID=4615 RepID=A0A199V7E7_ANACO|nr:Serine/threonine-protein kinase AFC3 [Ananas comosus]